MSVRHWPTFFYGIHFNMELSNLLPHIESLIFASEKPLTTEEITELINSAFGFMEDKITLEQIDVALLEIRDKYMEDAFPFEVKESGGGWQFLTKKDYHKTVAQLNGEKFLKRLSAAALETLAIIAYKQPITKGEIENIRGVSTDYTVQKLLEKELIVITGRAENLPGHPLVYATSKTFMDYFGINSVEDLPKIKEVLSGQLIQPTVINHTDFEQSGTLSVSDDGQLIEEEKRTAALNAAAENAMEDASPEHTPEPSNTEQDTTENSDNEEIADVASENTESQPEEEQDKDDNDSTSEADENSPQTDPQ